MSAPTGDPALIRALNTYLGQELGQNEYGEPYYSWRWSEKCFWPAARTGRMIEVPRVTEIMVIGGGTETCEIVDVVPEYRRDRQVRLIDTWLITKWLTPWELITGPTSGHIKHGDQYSHAKRPSDEAMQSAWARLYPGADFPAQGWRIPTDASLPREIGGTRVPDWANTRDLVSLIRQQTSKTFDQAMKEWEAGQDRQDTDTRKQVEDEIRDSFGAFLNPTPGARGNFVSFPWTKIDRER